MMSSSIDSDAPIAPISAATVAEFEPRFRMSMAIAAYEMATPPSATSLSEDEA
jgi:hypothetical protein